jgi:two-component system chemotaxis response regulator CheB
MAEHAVGRPLAVVIGGSVGALDTMRGVVRSLPSSLLVPIVLVIHLPAHATGLTDLLANDSAVPVKQAEDKEQLSAGTVYVAPPSYHLLIADAPVHYSRPAIDVLFESARDVYGAHVIGILLSGASEDGAAGLQEIHMGGGTTIVQAPLSAESAIMPAAALALFEPTYIWSPTEIVTGLNRLLSGSTP